MADSTFAISDIRGGINNSDSPTLLKDNEVADARNVDFRDGALGSKRGGTLGVDLSGSILNSPIVALITHTPTNDIANDELWALDENGNLDRRVGSTWTGGVTRVNTNVVINSRNFNANGVSLHGKLFIAAQGTQDRLLVWDGTVLRWAGIAAPPAPTFASTAVAGSYSGTRYVRIRFVEQSASGAVLRRSEPSSVVSLVPSGTFDGAIVTKPAGTEVVTTVTMEGQTHWEVELSVDNILFYRVATVAIGTPTYTDRTAFNAGYTTGTLSEVIGEYVPPGSARHVAVDEDRLLMAGSYFVVGNDATVWWTPVGSNPGKGNDERLPTATLQFITFDGRDGGRVNALVSGVSGNTYVFKATRVYKMVRTGTLSGAYSSIVESFARGALFRAACVGADATGVPCAYFLDQHVGLCRIGKAGVEDLSVNIRTTWRTRNPSPAISPRILYYPAIDQVWFTLPVGSGDLITSSDLVSIVTADGVDITVSQSSPGLLAEHEVKYDSIMFHDGLLGEVQALALAFHDTGYAPIIGTPSRSIGGGNFSTIHYADTGTTDSGTAFKAYVLTKCYLLGNLWTKFGLMAAALISRAVAGTTLAISMVRNFGVETRAVTVDLSPVGTEDYVVKPIDNASMSELNTVQIQYGDAAVSAQAWSIDQIVFKIRGEEGSAG